MSEIKFRAWDFNRKIILQVKKLDPPFWIEEKYKTVNFELQQYTGLKDMNGVDIYEGDIVEISDFEDSYFKKVVYENVCFYCINKHNVIMLDECHRGATIFGNKFENPEILESI